VLTLGGEGRNFRHPSPLPLITYCISLLSVLRNPESHFLPKLLFQPQEKQKKTNGSAPVHLCGGLVPSSSPPRIVYLLRLSSLPPYDRPSPPLIVPSLLLSSIFSTYRPFPLMIDHLLHLSYLPSYYCPSPTLIVPSPL